MHRREVTSLHESYHDGVILVAFIAERELNIAADAKQLLETFSLGRVVC